MATPSRGRITSRHSWLIWAVAGAILGGIIGFGGWFIHVRAHWDGPVTVIAAELGGGYNGDDVITGDVSVFHWKVYEERGPYKVVAPQLDRWMNLLAWPVWAGCIVVGALAGVYASRLVRRR